MNSLPKLLIVSATAVMLIVVAPIGFAQETTEAPTVEAPASEPAASPTTEAAEAPTSSDTGITIGLELLQTLAGEEGKMQAAMTEINDSLAQELKDAANAGAVFDKMIALVEQMAEFGGPDSAFVANIEATIALGREIAIEAREIGDDEVVAQMEREIAALETMRKTALELYSDSFRTIRDIEAQRSRFLLRMRANNVTQAREIAERGLEIVQKHNERLGEIRSAAVGDATEPVAAE